MKITNQKPTELVPFYQDKIAKDFDPYTLLKTTMVEPLFTPLIPSSPVSITENGNPLTENDITDLILNCCQETVDIVSEQRLHQLFSNALVHYNDKTNLNAKYVFAVQAANACQPPLPEPSSKVVYTPAADIIPTCRRFLGGKVDYNMLFASFAYYTRSETLGVYFANDLAFNDFKTWIANQMSVIGAGIAPDVCQKMADLQTLSLQGLTDSILLRKQSSDDNDPNSMSRLLVSFIMQYTQQVSSAEYGLFPFSVPELICPSTIVFINIERHYKATAREIADEWKLINNSIQSKPAMISINKLTKLTAVQRNLRKMQAMAATAASNNLALLSGASKSANFRFRKKEPTSVDMARIIKKVMDKMAYVNKSMNVYKSVKPSFARANRRDPDDYNKQGKVVSTKYKPDIHIYIDTSGSISEENYQDAIKACIIMAKKMNVNLYFNSFSHLLSQASLLHTKDKSPAAVYREFRKIPTVTGGTDYSLVWDYINRSKKRKAEISLLITDFEYSAPNRYINHPKNLYYIPCSKMNWDSITRYADYFAKSLVNSVPDIRKHLLF